MEIINLGDYWKVEKIQNNKEELMAVNREVGKCFRRAYRYLKTLDLIIEEIAAIYEDGRDLLGYYQLQENLLQEIFKGKVPLEKVGFERHLFGSGITPEGVVDYLETVVGVMDIIYYVKGNWGTGWSALLSQIARKAIALGYDVEVYHTPLAPDMIADLIIPELNLAFTTQEKFLDQCTCVIDLDGLINEKVLVKYKEELEFAEKVYHQLLNQSIHYVNKAKLAHDDLESFYIPYMDFDGVNEKRREVVERILQYEK